MTVKYFENHVRQDYFTDVTKWDMSHALVFLDPDIGIQPEDEQYWHGIANNPKKAEKYVLKSEIELLLEKPMTNSAFMIYQHLQWNSLRHEVDAKKKRQVLTRYFGENVSSTRCGAVQYLFSSKNAHLQQAINETLQNHATTNDMIFETTIAP